MLLYPNWASKHTYWSMYNAAYWAMLHLAEQHCTLMSLHMWDFAVIQSLHHFNLKCFTVPKSPHHFKIMVISSLQNKRFNATQQLDYLKNNGFKKWHIPFTALKGRVLKHFIDASICFGEKKSQNRGFLNGNKANKIVIVGFLEE